MVPQRWPAPAKLNLFLHITGRRADGYHELQTAFQFVDFADYLEIQTTQDGQISVQGMSIPSSQNLIVRAARLLQQRSGCNLGCFIRIDKQLPLGAGLGGGSSNAATTLLALNELWKLHYPHDVLAAWGGELGADIPIFVRGEASWAEGLGEQLQPLLLPEPWYVLLLPTAQVVTAEMFAAPELTRNCPPITIASFRAGEGINVFEDVVRCRVPLVARALDWLGQFGQSRLTGTGAAVFAAFSGQAAASQVLTACPSDFRCLLVKGMNRSLLHSTLTEMR